MEEDYTLQGNMECHIPDEQGHVDVPGHTAIYPQGYRVFFLHGEYAGMEPIEQPAETQTTEEAETPTQQEV